MCIVVDRLGGSMNGELGVGILNKGFVKESYKARLVKLKDKYDPDNMLNKGKVL